MTEDKDTGLIRWVRTQNTVDHHSEDLVRVKLSKKHPLRTLQNFFQYFHLLCNKLLLLYPVSNLSKHNL